MHKRTAITITTIVLLALTRGTAWAGDNIQATVTEVAGWPHPAIKINGDQAIQGTIQLFYVVDASTFPTGEFARFNVGFSNAHLSGQTNAVYPATLTMEQIGSSFLTLTAVQSEFTVGGLGPVGSTEVSIHIAEGAPTDDGTDLVANLRLTIPAGNKVGTPTNIQVHVRLVHPVNCLRTFHFMTDSGMNDIYESMIVKINAKKGEVSSTNPSQISDNLLIANGCGWDETFDLNIVLDPRFQTSPNGSAGNAVHTYNSNGVVEQGTFNMSLFGAGTGQKQNLCLQNVTVPAGTSFLAAVHSAIVQKLPTASLGVAPFTFVGSLTQAGYACGGGVAAFASEDSVTLNVPFTVE